jgi:hypothetical protein
MELSSIIIYSMAALIVVAGYVAHQIINRLTTERDYYKGAVQLYREAASGKGMIIESRTAKEEILDDFNFELKSLFDKLEK